MIKILSLDELQLKGGENMMSIVKKWCIVFVIVNISQVSFNQLYAKPKQCFIKDETTGCEAIVDICPATNLSMRWSGQCEQQEGVGVMVVGKGQLRLYQNNELIRIYFGEMQGTWVKMQIQQYQHGELQSVLVGKMSFGLWDGNIHAYQFQNGELVSYAIENYHGGDFVKTIEQYRFENGQFVKTSTTDEQNTPTPLPVQPTIPPTKNPPSPVQPIKPRTQQPIKSHCDRVCSGESGLFGAAEALERKDCGCPFDKFTTCRAILLDCTSKCAGLNILPGPKDTTCEPKCQKNFEDCMK